MRTIPKFLALAGVLTLVAVAGGWIVYSRAKGQPEPPQPIGRAVKVYTSTITVDAKSPRSGAIVISASANATRLNRDSTLWFNVVITRLDGESGQRVWAHSFDGVLPDGTPAPEIYTHASKGKAVQPKLPEFTVPANFDPGQYAIFVEVVEDTPEANEEGVIVNPSHGVVGATELVTVQ